MKTKTKIAREAGIHISTDMMMGLAGCCLAMASTSFGIYMTVHGPAPGVGQSHDFTVFAQFAPRMPAAAARHPSIARPDDLDMTATASIPGVEASGGQISDDTATSAMATAVVEDATEDNATVAIGGHLRTVRVGDSLPDAGDVIAIKHSPHPSVTTTRGVIRSAQAE